MNVLKINLSRAVTKCPVCGAASKRHSAGHRRLRDIRGQLSVVLEVIYTKHFCPKCRKYFSVPMVHLAEPAARYSLRVKQRALAMLDGRSSLEQVSRELRRQYSIDVPATTLHDWRKLEVSRENSG